jgi:hypothetical protein
MAEEPAFERLLRQTAGVVHTEDILVEAVRDLVKDEIKRYIRERLEGNPALRDELKGAVGELMEAKLKEAYAFLRIAKASAKLGLELVPRHLRGEVTKELAGIIEKEMAAILERTG